MHTRRLRRGGQARILGASDESVVYLRHSRRSEASISADKNGERGNRDPRCGHRC
jgi:hypothetical protein